MIPGFYGSTPNGSVKTFSRGGSDITGAIIARGVGAALYENWTDVSGLLMADPRIVDKPASIVELTYRELRELAYIGRDGAARRGGIPRAPRGHPCKHPQYQPPGRPRHDDRARRRVRRAYRQYHRLAGRKDFTVIAIEKAMMNSEIGFGRRVLSVLETNDVSFEHLPSGIDTMSLVIADSQLEDKIDDIVEGLHAELHLIRSR